MTKHRHIKHIWIMMTPDSWRISWRNVIWFGGVHPSERHREVGRMSVTPDFFNNLPKSDAPMKPTHSTTLTIKFE